jgi:hypothetical protein
MTLREKQSRFAQLVGRLIIYAYDMGYQLTFGDAWAKKGEGRRHSKNSFHYKRLAIDFNLFKDGKYLDKTEDHKRLGEYWEKLDVNARWGGRWNDGNHYEYSRR